MAEITSLGRPDASVQLVALDEQHLEATLAWVNDPELMQLLNRGTIVSPDEHRRWYEHLGRRDDCRYFAVETRDGRHVGNIWLWDIDRRNRRAEVRVLFGDPAGRDRGLGTEAIVALASAALGPMQLHRLYAYVLTTNPRGRRAFEKAGFRPEGVLRHDRWSAGAPVDVHLLARLATDPAGAAFTAT